MIEPEKKQLLFVNMEYAQNEINEPINVDVLLQYFPTELFDKSNVTIMYRDFFKGQIVDIKKYDIVLISTKISSLSEMQALLDTCEGKLVIVGGILAICAGYELACLYPEVIFNTGEAESNIYDILGMAVVAQTIAQLKEMICRKKTPDVCFYYEPTGGIYRSKRTVCGLKDKCPPIHHKLNDVIKNDGLVRMETSRGCPWNKCSFCIMPWKFCAEKWRAFSNEKIEIEIKYLIDNGAREILFTDEDFVCNYEHVSSLCSIIKRCTESHKQAVSFGGSTSVLTLYKLGNSLDFCLQNMHDVGITHVFLGIESGSNSQLKRYNKGASVSMNEEIISKLQKYEMEIDVGFIMFDADTTIEELEDNLNFIEKTGLKDTVSRFAKKLRVTPHTAIYNDYISRDLITSDLDIDNLCYDYNFLDSNIELICLYVDALDAHILKESYYLQAIIRSTADKPIKKTAHKRLLSLRECCYLFLRDCVNQYKENKLLSKSDVQLIYNKYLYLGGINSDDY